MPISTISGSWSGQEKVLREKQAENGESQKAHEGQEQGVDGDAVGLLEVLFAPGFWKGWR